MRFSGAAPVILSSYFIVCQYLFFLLGFMVRRVRVTGHLFRFTSKTPVQLLRGGMFGSFLFLFRSFGERGGRFVAGRSAAEGACADWGGRVLLDSPSCAGG